MPKEGESFVFHFDLWLDLAKGNNFWKAWTGLLQSTKSYL